MEVVHYLMAAYNKVEMDIAQFVSQDFTIKMEFAVKWAIFAILITHPLGTAFHAMMDVTSHQEYAIQVEIMEANSQPDVLKWTHTDNALFALTGIIWATVSVDQLTSNVTLITLPPVLVLHALLDVTSHQEYVIQVETMVSFQSDVLKLIHTDNALFALTGIIWATVSVDQLASNATLITLPLGTAFHALLDVTSHQGHAIQVETMVNFQSDVLKLTHMENVLFVPTIIIWTMGSANK